MAIIQRSPADKAGCGDPVRRPRWSARSSSCCRSTCCCATGCPPSRTSPRRTGRSSRRRCSGATSPSCSTTRPCRWPGSLVNSLVIAVAADRRCPGDLGTGGLRAGPDPVPVRERGLLRDRGHPADPGGGDLRAELRARLHARLGQQLARPDRPGAVPGVRDVPVPAVLPRTSRRSWRRRRGSTGSATGARSGGSWCRTRSASSPRSARSPSSAAGTRSSGRW